MKKYPMVKKKGRGFPVKTNPIQPYAPLYKAAIPNIFQQNNEKVKYGKGRIHCESIERTAIYYDACGNKVVLKENKTSMNSTENGPSLMYEDNYGRIKKKKY